MKKLVSLFGLLLIIESIGMFSSLFSTCSYAESVGIQYQKVISSDSSTVTSSNSSDQRRIENETNKQKENWWKIFPKTGSHFSILLEMLGAFFVLLFLVMNQWRKKHGRSNK